MASNLRVTNVRVVIFLFCNSSKEISLLPPSKQFYFVYTLGIIVTHQYTTVLRHNQISKPKQINKIE